MKLQLYQFIKNLTIENFSLQYVLYYMKNCSYATSISIKKVKSVDGYYFKFKSSGFGIKGRETLLRHPSEYLKVGRYFEKAGIVLSYRRLDEGGVTTHKGILEFFPDKINYSTEDVKRYSFKMVMKQILICLKIDEEKWIKDNDDMINEIMSSWGSDQYWENIRMEAFRCAKDILVQKVMID